MNKKDNQSHTCEKNTTREEHPLHSSLEEMAGKECVCCLEEHAAEN